MPSAFKYIAVILACLLCSLAHAQMTIQGVSLQGVNSHNGNIDLLNAAPYNLVITWDARSGVLTPTGDNVSGWFDAAASFPLSLPATVSQPTKKYGYGTPALDCVYFSGTNQLLINHGVSKVLNNQTNGALIVIQLVKPELTSTSRDSLSANNRTTGTAAIPSIQALETGTVASNMTHRASSDTTSFSSTANWTNNTTDGRWYYTGLYYSNGQLRAFVNNSYASSLSAVSSVRTLDTFALGGVVHSNLLTTNYYKGGIAGTWIFTPALSNASTAFTSNIVNILNADRNVFQ